jgi:hypothetical protein
VSSKKRHCREEDPTISSKSLYNDIFDNIVVQLQERFGSLPQMQFTSLLDPLKYEAYRTNFPVSEFETLKQTHKDLFDFVISKNELTVLYSLEDFFYKHPYQLVCSLKSRQLDTALPEIFKLGLLIVTVPSTTASVEISFSALKRIKTYQRSTQNEQRLSGLEILSIEKKDVLHQLKSTATFYDNVITKFTIQERKMYFTFKQAAKAMK